jgi:1-acyl-sn-glycerol-3-phosphate acyltransferase
MRLTQRALRVVGSQLLAPSDLARVRRIAQLDAVHGYDLFGMHHDWVALARALLGPVYKHYFRVTSYGAAHVPADGAAILVANHAGTLPIDAAMICLDVFEHTEPPRLPRPIADQFAPRLPFVGPIMSRLGAVAGALGNVRHLLEQGQLCLIFPEGMGAIDKPWKQRYRLHSWRVGHAELALRLGVPVIPVAVIGSEEQWPQLGRIAAIHPFGIPYLPLVATPLPLPVHYHIHYGPPLTFARPASAAALSVAVISQAAYTTRAALQTLLDQSVAERRGIFR